MRAELLDSNTLRNLAEARDFKEFLEILSKTPYGEELANAEIDVLELEQILNKKFLERLNKIIISSPKEISEFIKDYYIMGLEIKNLKRILRGKFSGMPSEWIARSLIPMRPYLSVNFEELLETKTLEEFVEALKETAYATLSESLRICVEHEVLWPMEACLNGLHVDRIEVSLMNLSPEDRVIVKRVLQTRMDIENLLAADKWGKEFGRQTPPRGYFYRIYGVPLEVLESLIKTRDLEEIIKSLGPPYYQILKPLLEDDVALVRRYLQRYIYEVLRKSKTRSDFAFPAIFFLLTSFENEIENLASIAWGKEQGVPPKKILKYILLPS